MNNQPQILITNQYANPRKGLICGLLGVSLVIAMTTFVMSIGKLSEATGQPAASLVLMGYFLFSSLPIVAIITAFFVGLKSKYRSANVMRFMVALGVIFILFSCFLFLMGELALSLPLFIVTDACVMTTIVLLVINLSRMKRLTY
ncbi:MAG: hypothetical protein LBM09_03050 [Candidatus Nomurabacteria bacterium]|jgi:hypothetical protein|nr:hypothetical protein [Candidatus Nomurabacteria bacterium]